ncbi:hypothetical protein [uncultured Psychrobacter sp.]|uniref:hypothetical protein n=1 Tax=uncultured Psychrobacter sp. TaxID=259303 RepID=UPI00345A70A7
MKKLLASTVMLATFALAGCTATGPNTTAGTNTGSNSGNHTGNVIGSANEMGMNIFKAAIDNQCRSQIEKQNTWRIASTAMTEAQEEAVKSKVCGCVSEQAPQQVTLVELGNAAIDTEYRAKLVTRVVAKSLQSCYGSIIGA